MRTFRTATTRSTAPERARGLLLAVATLLLAAVPASAALPAADAADSPCETELEAGFEMLFDGTEASLAAWEQSGPGGFSIEECTLVSSGGLGLLWYAEESFEAYTLRLDWKLDKVVDNSGVFVGFPALGDDPFVAVDHGYEIQIDEIGRMDAQPEHYTGAIYDIQGPDMPAVLQAVDPTDWNAYEITVDAPEITISINGTVVNEFTSTSHARDLSHGFVGLQNHGEPDVARFRNVRMKRLQPSGDGSQPGPATGRLEELRNNIGIAQDPTSGADFDGVGYSYSAAALQVAGAEPGGTVAADGFEFTWPDTASGEPDNVIAGGQTLTLDAPADATRLGFLGAASHGPATGTATLNYVDAAGIEQAVEVAVTLSDWTLSGGGAEPSDGNVVAAETPVRMLSSAVPLPTTAYVFVASVPLDPTMRLTSVTLPQAYSGQLHLFDVATSSGN